MQSVSITTEVRNPLRRGIFVRYTLCDKVCQCLTTGQWFSPCILVSSANKPDRHDINEILLKVAFNTRNKEGNLLNRYILICIPDKKESMFSITNGVDNLFFSFIILGHRPDFSYHLMFTNYIFLLESKKIIFLYRK